jgi:DHA1 family bicyclomycin/chloramphenicol resistance-like MFS transporter
MNKRLSALLPNLIVPLAGLSTDIYLPSLPAMATEFAVGRGQVQLTLTAFILAMGLSQFIAGPISDAIGRRKLIVTAIIIQMLAIVGIIFSSDIIHLICLRFIQGVAAAFMSVPARAILNDSFEGIELKKKFNYLTISFAIAPIIAPFIGGYCQEYWGWRACFYVVLAYAVFILTVVIVGGSETLKNKRPFQIKDIWHNYKAILSNRSFLFTTLLICSLFAYSSMNTALGAFIFQTNLGLSAVSYGYIALSMGLAWFLGNISNRFLFSVDNHKKIRFSLVSHSILVSALLISALFGIYNIAWTIICLFLIIITTALLFPIFVGEVLSLFPTMAASSNACLFSLTWVAFATYTIIATQISVKTLLPLSCFFLAINGLCHWVYKKIPYAKN